MFNLQNLSGDRSTKSKFFVALIQKNRCCCCGCDSADGWVRMYSMARWIAAGTGGGVGKCEPATR